MPAVIPEGQITALICRYYTGRLGHEMPLNQGLLTLAHGCANIFNDLQSLKMKPNKNHTFYLAFSDNSWMNYSELL